ncbi:MAG: hypothetical protein E7573_06985 [Ruminococcaceae bacterium]|nr:hypothetical protein [Oscillospiraceae bacterium]
MKKQSENIKKRKEKELKKKRKALEKRRLEAKKNDPAFTEKMKQKKAEDKRIKSEALKEKIGTVTKNIASNKLFLPVAAVLCFAVMCGICYLKDYRIFSADFRVNGIFQCLYLGDFSIGLSSRLLIGSILSLFTDIVTANTINIFAKIALYFSLIMQAVLAAAVIKKGISDKNVFVLLFSVIFIVNPVTVCSYSFYFGTLDLYNYIVFFVSVIILMKGKSSLQLIVPVLGVIGLLIHYSFFFAFFPALFVLGLYRTVNSEGKELKKEAASLGVNSVLSVGGFFYLSVFAKHFLRMNAEEMIEHVKLKSDPESVYVFEDYLKFYLYDIYKGEQFTDTGASLSELIRINLGLTEPSVYIKYLLFISVILIIFWAICGILIKREKGKHKLPFIAAAVMPFALVPELILSSDVWRWVASTVLCQFFVLFAFYLMNVPSVTKLLEDIKRIKLPVKIIGIIVLIIYIGVCFMFEHSLYR